MKKNKLFAPFLMLLAGAVASISMRYFGYSTQEMLPILLIVLTFFYVAGVWIERKVNDFVEQIKAEEAKAGEVVEKEVPDEEEVSEEAGAN